MKTDINVNRSDFISWAEGGLLIRDSQGGCVVGDHVDHERAKMILDAKGVVGLLVNGKIVSTLRLTSEGYLEEACTARRSNRSGARRGGK